MGIFLEKFRNSFESHLVSQRRGAEEGESQKVTRGTLGGDEVQTLVKFVNRPSPHPGSFLKAPMPLPWGEGGRRPGEGAADAWR